MYNLSDLLDFFCLQQSRMPSPPLPISISDYLTHEANRQSNALAYVTVTSFVIINIIIYYIDIMVIIIIVSLLRRFTMLHP